MSHIPKSSIIIAILAWGLRFFCYLCAINARMEIGVCGKLLKVKTLEAEKHINNNK